MQYGSECLTSTSGREEKAILVGIPNFLLHVVIHLLSYDKTLLLLLLLLSMLVIIVVGKRRINCLVYYLGVFRNFRENNIFTTLI
jgi:hypothetical protein